MLLSAILALCIFAALAFGVFIFAPVKISCSGSYTESEHDAAFYLSWFHPSVLRCDVNGQKRTFSIIALGRYRLFSSTQDETPKKAPDKGNGGADQVPRQEPVVEKSAPFDEREKSYGHSSAGPIPRQEKPREEPRAETVDKEKAKEKKLDDESGRRRKGVFGFLKEPAVLRVKIFLLNARWRRRILGWLRASAVRFFHIVSVSCFKIHVKLGLGDPSQTGKAFGYYIAAKYAFAGTGRNSRKEILFEPVFDREITEADGRIEISSSIARLCLPVVLAVLTFPYVHTLILLLRARKIRTDKKKS
jgi:Protein of unknown function (DUF2953)